MESRLQIGLDREALERAAVKYHFAAAGAGLDGGEIQKIYEILHRNADCRAVWTLDEKKREASVVVTLGARVDALQEKYGREGLLTECYLTDCLCRELLKKGYKALEDMLRERFGLYAERYLFPGQNLALEKLEQIFSSLGESVPVRLLPGGVLLPRQSVAYLLRLSADERTGCADICAQCGKCEAGTDTPDCRRTSV